MSEPIDFNFQEFLHDAIVFSDADSSITTWTADMDTAATMDLDQQADNNLTNGTR